MRFFIALEVPEQNRLELQKVGQKLKEIIPEARLTDNDKLHLTVAFVGEQPESLKEDLIKVLKKSSEAMSPFEVTPAYIDGFPNIHKPHTFWVGIKGDIDRLLLIREKVKDGLLSLNLEVDERRFIPHIAIAKVTGFTLSPSQEAELQQLMAQPFTPIQVSSLKLFESIQDEAFHTHNTLFESPLEG